MEVVYRPEKNGRGIKERLTTVVKADAARRAKDRAEAERRARLEAIAEAERIVVALPESVGRALRQHDPHVFLCTKVSPTAEFVRILLRAEGVDAALGISYDGCDMLVLNLRQLEDLLSAEKGEKGD